jgi:hypothetical protein
MDTCCMNCIHFDSWLGTCTHFNTEVEEDHTCETFILDEQQIGADTWDY